MINILLLDTENAYLPEIPAYIKYFNNTGKFRAYPASSIKGLINYSEYDVIWEFKGLGGVKLDNHFIIHDYPSLSTGNHAKIKNFLKTKFNPTPNVRIFLNEDVKEGLKFNDQIPFLYRDMGIDEMFFDTKSLNYDYDFVYVGSISKARGIDRLLFDFIRTNSGKLCLIGEPDEKIFKEFKNYKNITFTGKLPYGNVPEVASKAEFGINYIPDKYPFNIQTSTKLLEYLAMGLKIVSTDYQWVRKFEKKTLNNFYYLKNNDFNMENIRSHQYRSMINKEDFIWDNIIKKSGIEDVIENALKSKNIYT